ncbi:MAG: calcium-binding protein [Acidisphaera sp.]|nr:calcium-binding protein [Acidisphaera sp.]
MSNNVQTLSGNQFAYGSAFDNTGTDQFAVYGPDNTIEEDGGNLTVVGEADPGFKPGHGNYDTGTTIFLNGSSNDDGAATKTTDTITLDGSGNSIVNNSGYLYKSTISITLTGKGPQNTPNPQAGNYPFLANLNNLVALDNVLGTTSVTLTGMNNAVFLNGDATNTVVTGSGNATVYIGNSDDDTFGHKSKITLGGSSNYVAGGDENYTITGGVNLNSISLGDGTNSVSVTGSFNDITVGGGNNVINAGSRGLVNIVGVDGTDGPTYSNPDGPDDGPVPVSPNDTITMAGSNDTVFATYENVTINGSGATGMATVDLGNGNNAVNLGGNANTISLGDGSNTVTLTGADNLVQVTSTAGTPGTDTVSVGSKDGNTVNLSFAGGSVTGNGNGKTTTTVMQNTAATANVTVNLGNAVGQVTLGNGNDTVTANGNGSTITAGSGADTVTANGNMDTITLGDAPGAGDTVVATGSHDTINVVANAGTSNSFTVGSQDNVGDPGGSGYLAVTGGIDKIMGAGNGGAGDSDDYFYLNNIQNGSSVTVFGNNTMTFLGSDSSAKVTLGGAATKDTITVQADSSLGNYAGTVEISGFGIGQTIDLQGLDGAYTKAPLTSITDVYVNTNSVGGTSTLNLLGGGKVVFDNFTAFKSSEFVFSTSTGPVAPTPPITS